MAHCACMNGHSMWNSDGKPVIWAFRFRFFKEFTKNYPHYVLGEEPCLEIYDCYDIDNNESEELDCWYCEECKSLVVFANNDQYRYDYKFLDEQIEIEISSLNNYEEYIAFHDREFENFSIFYEGMTTIEALEKYPRRLRCFVSPNKEIIYVFDNEGHYVFSYQLIRLIKLYKEFNDMND